MWRDESEIDRTIDEVARKLTEREPDTDARVFRARVIARLDERRSTRWRSWWMLAPVTAAAAAIVIALLVYRQAPNAPMPGPKGPGLQTGPKGLQTARGPEPQPAVTPSPHAVPPDNPPSPRDAVRGLAPADSEVAALAPPRLEVESIALPEIGAGESLQLPQLEAIEPITLTPIGEPEGERR